MKLNIPERLTLVNLLPEKGGFATMNTIEGLTKVLYPSEAEVIKYEVKQDTSTISWNAEGAKQVEVKLSEKQFEFLLSQLEDLDKKEELTVNHYNLLKRFKDEKNK